MTKPFHPLFVFLFVLLFVLAAALLAAPIGYANPAPPRISAYGVRVENAGREIRLVFSLTACVDVRAYVLDSPARAIVDLPEIAFLIDQSQSATSQSTPEKTVRSRRARRHAQSPRVAPESVATSPESAATSMTSAAPSVKGGAEPLSYRFGRLSQGKSRIIVDLSAPAELTATCAAISGAGELTLRIATTDPASFRAAARAGAGKQAQSEPIAAPAPSAAPPAGSGQNPLQKPLIVLDPGHGGVDTGTVGRAREGRGENDIPMEKNVVLDFAKAMAEPLRASGRYRVAFTREDDTFVPLQQRVEIARKLGAALFISLHADSLRGAGASVQGATVYTVSERASDAEAARVAEKENKADALAGQQAQEQASEVNDILFDLTRRETRAYSNIFAKYLSERWKNAARLNKNPRRFAGFVVLKAPDVPSVLLELGYLSNAGDATELTSPQWREKAAAEAARAVDDFFSQRVATPAARP